MLTFPATVSVQAIGECMLEVVRTAPAARVGYAGDTFNTAVYLQRTLTALGATSSVGYLCGVGDDGESDSFRDRLLVEHLRDDSIVVPGAGLGLYLVRTDDAGERSFSYWRKGSASARLFAGLDWVPRVAGDVIYLSGISLQLMTTAGREALVARLAELRAAGSRVVFDSNYRPAGWESAEVASKEMAKVLAQTDIALVTFDDEHALSGVTDIDSDAARLRDFGIAEFVVKDGGNGAWVWDGDLHQVVTERVMAVDTTAAGDSFNGGYLAARIAGRSPVEAGAIGHAVAGAVVQHPGAIIPPAAMPRLSA